MVEFELKFIPNGMLYSDKEEFEALQDGEIQMIAPTVSKVTKLLPSFASIRFAFLISNRRRCETNINRSLRSAIIR